MATIDLPHSEAPLLKPSSIPNDFGGSITLSPKLAAATASIKFAKYLFHTECLLYTKSFSLQEERRSRPLAFTKIGKTRRFYRSARKSEPRFLYMYCGCSYEIFYNGTVIRLRKAAFQHCTYLVCSQNHRSNHICVIENVGKNTIWAAMNRLNKLLFCEEKATRVTRVIFFAKEAMFQVDNLKGKGVMKIEATDNLFETVHIALKNINKNLPAQCYRCVFDLLDLVSNNEPKRSCHLFLILDKYNLIQEAGKVNLDKNKYGSVNSHYYNSSVFEMYVSWIEFVPNHNLNMHFLNKHANAQSSSIGYDYKMYLKIHKVPTTVALKCLIDSQNN
ncbi:hypothetical protein AGLY_006163 [Aphis glycines]|uniref:Uncharacterized protein n=1 Tax=Aphis glycines TaxID=307491 RepID=A0A6G0TSZ6_APHGL|nr:hypothetical protein AGLY_006163 [Aphis glycines]